MLDDGLQNPGLRVELVLELVPAEAIGWSRWLLPAGPWRDSRSHADRLVVTRRTASPESALRFAAELAGRGRPVAVAALTPRRLERLGGGDGAAMEDLRGARVLVLAGVAWPHLLFEQLRSHGMIVAGVALRDHYRYSRRAVTRLVHKAGPVDYVVVTEKDAVKLRGRWPDSVPEPFVTRLEIDWEAGWDDLAGSMEAALRIAPGDSPRTAGAGPVA